MPLNLPEITLPLTNLGACASRISLVEHPDLADHIPAAKTVDLAILNGGSEYLRLTRERFDPEGVRCHFHLDIGLLDRNASQRPGNSTEEAILQAFEAIANKTLLIDFESKYRIAISQVPSISPITTLANLGMRFGAANAALSGANVRVADSVVREVRWKKFPATGDTPPYYVIDILGSMGEFPVTPDILVLASRRTAEAFSKFVLPSMPVHPVPSESRA